MVVKFNDLIFFDNANSVVDVSLKTRGVATKVESTLDLTTSMTRLATHTIGDPTAVPFLKLNSVEFRQKDNSEVTSAGVSLVRSGRLASFLCYA